MFLASNAKLGIKSEYILVRLSCVNVGIISRDCCLCTVTVAAYIQRCSQHCPLAVDYDRPEDALHMISVLCWYGVVVPRSAVSTLWLCILCSVASTSACGDSTVVGVVPLRNNQADNANEPLCAV
jgi:hypothetical protein